MSRVVALVQARMGSSRFPGKMLAPLGGAPILEWVLTRVKGSKYLDQVVLATSDLSRDDELVGLAKRVGVSVYRGSEVDVLGRFSAAAKFYNADFIVRVCADNPFIDPVEIDRLIKFYKNNPCDYACNHQSRLGNKYADGFGAEILSEPLLRYLSDTALELTYREHVTSYLWDNVKRFNLQSVESPPDLSYPELRFDIDTPEDYEGMQRLILAGVNINTSATKIVSLARSI